MKSNLPILLALTFLSLMILASCGRRSGTPASAPVPAVTDTVPGPQSFAPGDTVHDDCLGQYPVEDFFRVVPIPDEVFAFMQGKTYKSGCTVPRDELRYIICLHKDLQGRSVVGEMVAATEVAEKLCGIFLCLYQAGYPIEKMRLPDYWDADDDRMMKDNNSSCFNFRTVLSSSKLSAHSLGVAVDINPLYNPCVRTRKDGSLQISPVEAAEYADRSAVFSYKIEPGDLCHKLFLENGFVWGGRWRSVKDYQHFELSR